MSRWYRYTERTCRVLPRTQMNYEKVSSRYQVDYGTLRAVYKYRMIFFFHHWLFAPPFKQGRRDGEVKRSFTEKYQTRVYVMPGSVDYRVSALLFLDLLEARGVSRRHKYTSVLSGDRAKYSQLSLFYKSNVVKICLVSYETFFFFLQTVGLKKFFTYLKKIIIITFLIKCQLRY